MENTILFLLILLTFCHAYSIFNKIYKTYKVNKTETALTKEKLSNLDGMVSKVDDIHKVLFPNENKSKQ